MLSKVSFLLFTLFLGATCCFAQQLVLQEKMPLLENGIEYGYIVKNEQIKTNKGEEYSRYEITLYATNKTGCTKIYSEKRSIFSSNEIPNLLATFFCTNANGKRLTAKSGTIKAKDFNLSTTISENGKEVNKTVKVGYLFRNNETLRDNIIVLVPKGEQPNIQCTPNGLQEL